MKYTFITYNKHINTIQIIRLTYMLKQFSEFLQMNRVKTVICYIPDFYP